MTILSHFSYGNISNYFKTYLLILPYVEREICGIHFITGNTKLHHGKPCYTIVLPCLIILYYFSVNHKYIYMSHVGRQNKSYVGNKKKVVIYMSV